MTPQSPAVLERLLRDNDLGWMIDMYAPRDRAVPVLLEQLIRLTAEFQSRFNCEVSFAPKLLGPRPSATRTRSARFYKLWE